MREHEHARLVRRGYGCFETGDIETLKDLMARDLVWHEPGLSDISGDYKGPEAVMEFLGRLKAMTGGTFKVEIEAILADAERAVVLQHETAERDGDQLDTLAAVDFEIHQGRITEVTVYHHDCQQFDRFFTSV